MPTPSRSELQQSLQRRARGILEGAEKHEESTLIPSGLPIRLFISNAHIPAEEGEPSLPQYAAAMQVAGRINAQFTCEPINATEEKPACHPAARCAQPDELGETLKDFCNQAIQERRRMYELADALNSRSGRGTFDKPIQKVVHLGTGGSHWPAKLLYDSAQGEPGRIQCEFVASDHPAALETALQRSNPEETAVVVSSKSFRTSETLNNAAAAREWLESSLKDKASSRMIAITAQTEEAIRFGIDKERILRIPDWIGGRFSAWSAASLPAVAAHGKDWFEEVLAGGREMDVHVRSEPPENSLPLQLAMHRIWLHDFLGYPTRCLIPYSHGLRSFVDLHQQQLMESCGKQPDAAEGGPRAACEIVWGGEGPVYEHTFLQHLLQSGVKVPVEMIAFADDGPDVLAHCLGQREALRDGLSPEQAKASLLEKGMADAQAAQLAPSLAVPGGQPTITVLSDEYSPRSVGRLLALYEHSVIAQAAFRGVNPYDQWGVELGKERIRRMRSALQQTGKGKDESPTGADIAELLKRKPG